ncbi:MAG: TAXI family TRAP transporter solute-binding subunit [Kiloniellaceae bacterium]
MRGLKRAILRPGVLGLVLLGPVALSLGLGPGPRAAAVERTIVVGTAPVAGVYFPAGGALCNLVNRERARHGLRCLVESTRGSSDNLDRLRRGEIDFALIQSDWQYLAVENGHGPEGEPFDELRAVFSLHGQPVTVVAHPEAGITRLTDLKGRRVNLGPPGSGIRAVGEMLIGALGWRRRDFAALPELGVDEQVAALCAGRIDAFILPVSHPNGAIAAATESCGAVLIDVTGAAVDRLTAEWPFYAPVEIPGGLYRGNSEPVRSYGARATLVTTVSAPADAVYEVVRATFENLDALTRQHAALAGLAAKQMVEAGNTAAFHEGALRYYRERGWK